MASVEGRDPLEGTKRAAYVVACLIGAPVDLLGWRLSEDPAISAAYLTIGIALLCCAGLAISPMRLPLAERIAFGLVATTFVGRLVVVVFLTPDLGAEFAELLTTLILLCCVYLLAYLFLPRVPALIAGCAVLVFTTVVLAVGLAMRGTEGLPHSGMPLIKSYIMQPVFVVLLYILAVTREHMSLVRAREQTLAEMAATDPLTGLPNRRHLTETLARHAGEWARSERPVSVILLDIDHFKEFNDTHGHAVGDEVLRHVATTLAGELRAGDMIGRWGGEEFLIVAVDSDLDAAEQLALRCRARLHEAPPAHVGVVTASFGIATLTTDRDVDGLVRAADEALYLAKADGRDRVVTERAAESV